MRRRVKQQPKASKKAKPPQGKKRIASDEVMQETFLRHFRDYQAADAALEKRKSDLNKVVEKAKAEGVTKRSLKYALALKKDEGVEKAKAERDEQLRVATYLGFGEQLDMFVEQPADKDWEQGKLAAMENRPASPPPHLHQKQAQSWMHGWHHGMKIVNVNRAAAIGETGFLPIGETVADLAKKAGVSGALQEPPPRQPDENPALPH